MAQLDTFFTRILLQWYAENHRELPWRDTTDPYAIWLSEIILQQTRVEQGRPYWERFMAQWPTVEQLAAASEDEVLRMWQGLGYYSRARNLHAAARQIVEWGAFPNTFSQIKQLRGVGDYTAAAIASFAFGEPVAAVDGNAFRVLSRYFGISTPINTPDGKRTFTTLAQSLLPPHQASDYNAAIMDFGATQCTPRSPRCGECPFVLTCEAFRTKHVEKLPVKERKIKVRARHFIYIYVRVQGHTIIRRRGRGDIWQGLWEPLCIEVDDAGDILSASIDRMMAEDILHNPACSLLYRGMKHVLTHQVITADAYLLIADSRLSLPEEYVWIAESELDSYAKPRLVERLLDLL